VAAQKAKENALEKKTLLALATRAKIPTDITKGLTLPPLRKIIQRKKDLGVVTVILWRLLPQDVARYLMGGSSWTRGFKIVLTVVSIGRTRR